jgi:DnaK suppressor protein
MLPSRVLKRPLPNLLTVGRPGFSSEQLDMFRRILLAQRGQLLSEAGKVVTRMGGATETFADPSDRAAWENESTRDLRIRDRERKLMDKIDQALSRIEDGTFGECEECGEMITVGRLKARPVTTLCIECKAKQEADELRANRA